MNSFLLLCDVFSFIFWKKLKTPKRHFEIIWHLAVLNNFQRTSPKEGTRSEQILKKSRSLFALIFPLHNGHIWTIGLDNVVVSFVLFQAFWSSLRTLKIRLAHMGCVKGQLISKANFLALIWSKNQTKLFFDYHI